MKKNLFHILKKSKYDVTLAAYISQLDAKCFSPQIPPAEVLNKFSSALKSGKNSCRTKKEEWQRHLFPWAMEAQ